MTDSFSRRDFEARIIAKVWSNEEYKNRMIADPKAVVAEELREIYPDVELPASLQINIIEEAEDEMTIVVPPAPTESVVTELTDEELGSIAGGTSVGVAVAVVVVADAGAGVNVGVGVNVGAGANIGVGANIGYAANAAVTVNVK